MDSLFTTKTKNNYNTQHDIGIAFYGYGLLHHVYNNTVLGAIVN